MGRLPLLCKIILSALLLISGSKGLYAQTPRIPSQNFIDDPNTFFHNAVGIATQELLFNGIQVDYDRKIANFNWLKLSLAIYKKEDYTVNSLTDIRDMIGYGGNIQHKYIPYSNCEQEYQIYLAYGPQFRYFNIETGEKSTTTIYKFGFDCNIGFHKVFAKVFFIDIYGGVGVRTCKREYSNTTSENAFAKNALGYGYSGNVLNLGLNLGVLF